LAGPGWGSRQAQLPVGITRHGVAPSQSARNVTRPESYDSEQPVPLAAPHACSEGPKCSPLQALQGTFLAALRNGWQPLDRRNARIDR
jgi:hypothetical protein